MFWEKDEYVSSISDMRYCKGLFVHKSDTDIVYCNFNMVDPETGNYICKEYYYGIKEDGFVKIDKSIFNTICILNKKGYTTNYSDGGHFYTYDTLARKSGTADYFQLMHYIFSYLDVSDICFTINIDDLELAQLMVCNILACSIDLPNITNISFDKNDRYIKVNGLSEYDLFRPIMPEAENLFKYYNLDMMYYNKLTFYDIRPEIIKIAEKMRNIFDRYIVDARKEFEILATRLPDLTNYRR